MIRRVTVVAGLLALVTTPAGAQSLFNSAGLGLPVEALDGRARALGSLGIGLPGDGLYPTDPGAAARLFLPTAVMSVQPSWVDFTADGSGQKRYGRGSRFPLLGITYPALGGTGSILLTSFLDQRFRGARALSVDLGGAPVPATDTFEQEGSVSTLLLGYARMVTESIGVGLTAGRYSGTVERQLSREFGVAATPGAVSNYQVGGLWSYSGFLVTGGVSADVTTTLRVAASATWSGDLEATASESTSGSNRSYNVPLQLRVGGSAVLTPGLSLMASLVRADWSSLESDLSAGTEARATTGYGVGLELSQFRLLGKQAPLRVGYRRSGLPFSIATGAVTETALAGGLAFTLNETDEVLLASADFAVERGRRTGGGFTENFWRGTVSVRLAAF